MVDREMIHEMVLRMKGRSIARSRHHALVEIVADLEMKQERSQVMHCEQAFLES